MANSLNVNQNNNNVSLQDANGKVTITDDKLGVNIEVTQPVTNVVTVALIGPQGQPGEIPSTGSFVLTSSFNAFTASYYLDSASFDANILNNSSSISLLSGSFETFSGSYNTGSFTGSFYGDGSNLTGIVSSKWTGSNPITREGNVEITGSLIVSGSSTFINIGPAIFSGSVTGINGFTGSLLGTAESASYVLNAESASYALTASYAANVPLTASYALNAESASYSSTASYVELAQTSSYYDETDPVFTAVSGTFVLTSSFDQFTSSYNTGSFTGSFYGDGSNLTGIVSSKWTGSNPISRDGNVEITGSLTVNDGITGSLYGTASWAENSITASYVENAQTASYVLNAISSSYTQTASYVDTLNQDVLITGSLTVLQGATIYGSSSFTYITASQLSVSASFISVNVFEPAQRFGGLKVYDSGSSTASASLAWDSLHNHWVYENVDGATYTGGMLLSGPRNTGSLGDEPNLTKWRIPRSDGGDHLDDSQIYSSASITIVTGSLTVTNGITGSLSGSALTATSASYALTASYLDNYIPPFPYTGSALITGSLGVTGSLTATQIGAGAAPSGSVRLDVRASSSAATDIAFRVRNSADTADLISFRGDGSQWIQSVPFIHAGTLTGGTNTAQSLYLGYNSRGIASSGFRNVMIGTGAGSTISSNDSVCIGHNASAFNTSIAIGSGATAAANNFCVMGSESYPFSAMSIGTGGTVTSAAAVQNMIFSVGGVASGYTSNTDLSSKFFRIQSQGGSGTGNSAPIQFSVAPSGSGGFISNTFVIPLEIRGDAAGLNHYQLATPRISTSSLSDGYIQYSADRNGVAGKASPHFRTEDGTVVWLGDESRLFNVTASRTIISSSQNTISGSSLTVYGSGSTQPVFTVQGSQGELFSVTDSLSGSLFSVNDISGLPILEVFSDNTTLIGNYLDPMLITTAKVTQTNSGSFVLYSLPTASYDTAFFEYSVRSGSNARAGTIMAIQSGSAVNFTETTTTDFGSTSAISFTVVVTGSNMALTGSSSAGSWTIKTIVRGL